MEDTQGGAPSALSRCREPREARAGAHAGSSGPCRAGRRSAPQAPPVKPVQRPWRGSSGSSGRTVCHLRLHRRVEAKGAVNEENVVIDRLWDTHDAHGQVLPATRGATDGADRAAAVAFAKTPTQVRA